MFSSSHRLQPYPGSLAPAGRSVVASLDRDHDRGWQLHYRFHSGETPLILPPPVPSGPADGLWQHTCAELFVAAVDAPGYREFNFSPSGAWAAYAFEAYRQRDEHWEAPAVPLIEMNFGESGNAEMRVHLPFALLPAATAWRVSLTAVIEDARGLSYWALHHAAARPDFHHPDSFVLPLN